jgi:hypothetical protein
MARMSVPMVTPKPMSGEPRTALAVLIPISRLAAASPTNDPPAATEKPHWRRSFFKGCENCSAPHCAAYRAARSTAAHIMAPIPVVPRPVVLRVSNG